MVVSNMSQKDNELAITVVRDEPVSVFLLLCGSEETISEEDCVSSCDRAPELLNPV